MSLRNQPFSERAFATFVVLALAAFLAGGLVFTHRQQRSGQAQAPAVRSRLMAVLAGVMAPNVSAAEAEAFRVWVQGGATREGFGSVEPIVTNNCASCHSQGGQFPRLVSYEDLRPLALEEASDSLYALIGARVLHLAVFPLVFLVAAGGYLRRTAWPHRRLLIGASALAVAFDAAQWSVRQGRPELLWAAWMASAALAGTMVLLVSVVLRDLWRPKVS